MKSSTERPLARYGILSDTHGTLSEGVLNALRGVDHIFHAGDIGCMAILQALAEIAPVTAVRGNMDKDISLAKLPETSEFVAPDGRLIFCLHDLTKLDLNPEAVGIASVLHGHLHRASSRMRRGVLYLNPGSASCSRDDTESIAILKWYADRIEPSIIPLPQALEAAD